jgi:hypothetical protein
MLAVAAVDFGVFHAINRRAACHSGMLHRLVHRAAQRIQTVSMAKGPSLWLKSVHWGCPTLTSF